MGRWVALESSIETVVWLAIRGVDALLMIAVTGPSEVCKVIVAEVGAGETAEEMAEVAAAEEGTEEEVSAGVNVGVEDSG